MSLKTTVHERSFSTDQKNLFLGFVFRINGIGGIKAKKKTSLKKVSWLYADQKGKEPIAGKIILRRIRRVNLFQSSFFPFIIFESLRKQLRPGWFSDKNRYFFLHIKKVIVIFFPPYYRETFLNRT